MHDALLPIVHLRDPAQEYLTDHHGRRIHFCEWAWLLPGWLPHIKPGDVFEVRVNRFPFSDPMLISIYFMEVLSIALYQPFDRRCTHELHTEITWREIDTLEYLRRLSSLRKEASSDSISLGSNPQGVGSSEGGDTGVLER